MTINEIASVIKTISNINPGFIIEILPNSLIGNFDICFYHIIDKNIIIRDLTEKLRHENITLSPLDPSYKDLERLGGYYITIHSN